MIRLWRLLRRKRVWFGPVYMAGLAAALAGASFALNTGYAVVVTVAIAVTFFLIARVRMVKDKKRLYVTSMIVSGAAWVILTRMTLDQGVGMPVTVLLLLTLFFGFFWWISQRKRAQVRMEETVDEWPELAKRIGIGQSWLGTVVVSLPWRISGRIMWPGGVYNVDTMLSPARRRDLEGVFGAKVGSVRTEADDLSPSSIKFQIILQDPHAEPQLWEPPDRLRMGTDPYTLGPRENGTLIRVQRFVPGRGGRHVLIGGCTDSGKSSLINLFVAEDVCSEDVYTIGFDFKQVELTPWRKALGYMTSDVSEAKKLVLAIANPGGLIDERMTIASEHGKRQWNPEWGPWISIPVDEIRNLLGTQDVQVVRAFSRIESEGRAAGISTAKATQYPTVEAIGTTQIRENCALRFCFRMQNEEGEKFVLNQYVGAAHKIPANRPGTFLFSDNEVTERAPGRIRYLNDEMVRDIVDLRAGRTAELDDRSEAAIVRWFPEFADRPRWERDSEGNLIEVTAGLGDEDDDETPGVERDSQRDSAGPGPGLDEDDENLIPGLDGGPDVPMDVVLRLQRESMTQEERDRADRERESAIATLMPAQRLSEEEALQALRQLLRKAGEEGARPKDLRAGCNRSSTWLYEQLNKLLDEGYVQQLGRGLWGWTGPRST